MTVELTEKPGDTENPYRQGNRDSFLLNLSFSWGNSRFEGFPSKVSVPVILTFKSRAGGWNTVLKNRAVIWYWHSTICLLHGSASRDGVNG